MASTLNAKNRIQKKKKSFLFSSQQNITKHSRCQWHYFSGLQQPPPPTKNNENKRINDTNVRHNMFHFLFYFLFVCIYSISFGSFLTRHVGVANKRRYLWPKNSQSDLNPMTAVHYTLVLFLVFFQLIYISS